MTMPEPDERRETGPLGSEVAPSADPESQGGTEGPASGVAGPSYPPAETEPDAHGDRADLAGDRQTRQVTTPGSDPLSTPSGTPGSPTGSSYPPGPATSGPSAPTTTGRSTPERHPVRTMGRSLALALLIFVTVVLVLFVVFNNQTVDISLVFGNVRAPLVLALVVAAVLGGLLVWLAGLVRRARRRNR